MAIQGSVWINFSIPVLSSTRLYFLAYLVVSSIQMGATIDYAIVFTNRYLELKKTTEKKEAAAMALNQSFPTILTSGSILTLAGFLIGKISTNAIISALGTALGRGTLISIVIVMMVLPQIVLLCNKFIEKTSFNKDDVEAEKNARRELSGMMYVNGRIKGNVSGYVDGVFRGIVKGDVNARIELGEQKDSLLDSADDGEEESDIGKLEREKDEEN
jgi:ATP/ADP translocase